MQEDIKNALENLQKLLTKLIVSNEQKTEDVSNTDISENKVQQKGKEADNVLLFGDEQPNLKNDKKNAEKIKKTYRKLDKSEKDIYCCLNKEGEKVGQFYGTKPIEVAKKVANKVYREINKDLFDIKIYNRMTDRIYSYRVQIIPCEIIKRIKNLKIPITHRVKLIRI